MDSYHRNPALHQKQPTDPLRQRDPETLKHRYMVLQAVVGRRRLDELEGQIRGKLTLLLKAGQTLSAAFKFFNKDRRGLVTEKEFLLITRTLGIHITEMEAEALFGR